MSESVEEPIKRSRERSIGEKELRDVFVSNIPYDVSQAGLEGALKRMFGKFEGYLGVKRLMLQRGFAIVAFDSGENASAAVEFAQDLKLGPRKLFVKVNDPEGAKKQRMEREVQQDAQRSTGFHVDTSPNPDCWFCLANPKFENHVVFAVDEKASVYAALAKGGIAKYHCLIAPVTHYGCYAAASEEVQNTCNEFVDKISETVAAMDRDVVVYERWIPMNSTAANHMQIHFVPVERDSNIDWSEIVKSKGKEAEIEFIRVNSHADVVEKMKGILSRVSYLFISFPGSDGKRESWLGIGRMSFPFPREIVCAGTKCPERADWKSCAQSVEQETEQAAELKELFYKQ
jgi:diadenosine tetraphosphate (Ap4A) HIT family hydrolase